jgi:HlyD family secretion protein
MTKTVLPQTTKADEAASANGAEHTATLKTTVGVAESSPGYATIAEMDVLPPRRRRWRVLVPIVAAMLLVAGLLYFMLRPSKSVATAAVRRGTIISSVETTGKLQAEQIARLSFKTSGRVENVIAKQGDVVEVGAVLAELDKAAVQRQVDEARTQLEISKLKLQQAKEGVRDEDVAAATAERDAAVARLNQLKSGGRPEDVAAAQAQLNQAQAAYDALKKGASTQEIAAAQARLDAAKANRSQVAAAASNTKEQARITVAQARNAVRNAQDVYDRIKAANSTTDPKSLTQEQKDAEQRALRDLQDAQGKLSQAELNYDTAKQSETAQVNAASAQVNEAQAALDKVKAGPTAEELRQAEEAVAQAKANLNRVKNGASDEEIAQAQSAVDAAQAQLDKVKAGPTSTDIAILEQQINLAQIALDSAQAQLADATLTSPINGTLLSIDLRPGEIVGAMQPIATVADTGSLRIKADIDEIDVGRVSAGQPVTVTLDAYPGVKMPGKIESLAPGATLKQGSTVYQATISFSPVKGVTPREGMAANVDITAQRKDNVLLLPNRAFETVGRRQYVTLMEKGTTRKIEVETGLSNPTDTEVVSGLSEGQLVILR